MKRVLGILLAFFLLMPFSVQAAKPSTEELLKRIEELSRELESLKKQLAEMKEAQEEQSEAAEETQEFIEEVKNNMGKFKIWGDIRTRMDSTRAYVPENKYMFSYVPAFTTMVNTFGQLVEGVNALMPGAISDDQNVGALMANLPSMLPMLPPDLQAMAMGMAAGFQELPSSLQATMANLTVGEVLNVNMPVSQENLEKLARTARSGHRENDTLWTNRMRLNFKVKPTENTVVKARLTYYKIWGMTNDYVAPGLFPPSTNNFTLGVRPSDDALYVDRAYFNWANIADLPIWISFGRRPTTHGSPLQLREGLDKRDATPAGINIDVPFDGATIGFQYSWPWTGRIRFCYGRGFESGFKRPIDRAKDDIDFYGFAWDVIDDPDRNMLLIVQAFKAEGVMDFPDGQWYMFNPVFNSWMPFGVTTQHNLGDIYEIGATWQHKVDLPFLNLTDVDYFVSVGLSITDPDEWGYMGVPIDHNGNYLYMYYSLLAGPYLTLGNPDPVWSPADDDDLDTHTGWAIYLGTRIPLPWVEGAKLGLEYNYGSKWWLPFMVATDDAYFNKLATRGHVGEIYWIQDLPTGELLNDYARAYLRVGFQYYWFNYTGSGVWLGKPYQIRSELDDQDSVTMFQPIEHMYNFYLSFELAF